MDYEKKSSGIAKAGLATGITGTALGVLDIIKDQWGCKRDGGYGRDGYGYGPGPGYGPAPYPAPGYGYPGKCDCYVTEKEMCLIRENADKGDVIARQASELYTNATVTASLGPVYEKLARQQEEICCLKTHEAVNAARDQDFRHYVEREFIHQPKAGIRESLVVCHQCGCECGDRDERRGREEFERGRFFERDRFEREGRERGRRCGCECDDFDAR